MLLKLAFSDVYALSDGGTYDGEVKDGKFHGRGVLVEKSGDTYDGEWHNNYRHGHGALILASGGSYIGQWWKGIPHGQGDGDIFLNKDNRTWKRIPRHVGQWFHGAIIGTLEESRDNDEPVELCMFGVCKMVDITRKDKDANEEGGGVEKENNVHNLSI
jgi:hypothetical protein